MTRNDLEQRLDALEQTPDDAERDIEITLPNDTDEETRAEIAAVARGERDRDELSAAAAAAIRTATLPDAAREGDRA